MTTRETTSILATQEALILHIKEDMFEHTGEDIPFTFTENLFFVAGRVWHEFSLNDGETLLYAFLFDNGVAVIAQDMGEVHRY